MIHPIQQPACLPLHETPSLVRVLPVEHPHCQLPGEFKHSPRQVLLPTPPGAHSFTSRQNQDI